MNERDETLLLDDRREDNIKDKTDKAMSKSNATWKKVTFGTASGILVGAGTMYAADMFGAEGNNGEEQNEKSEKVEDVRVAKIGDDMTFSEAFNSARDQVGPGGVFRWHNGLYGTYTESEWNAMSDDDKAEFAQAVRPEVMADEIVAERISETNPDIVITQTSTHNVHDTATQAASENARPSQQSDNGDISDADTSQQPHNSNEEDVHVVGYGQVQGHQAVAVDLTGNGEADVAVIDMNDNGQLDDPDVVVDSEGNSSTMGQLVQAQASDDSYGYTSDETGPNMDPNLQQTAYENPDLSPDMPDYMDDANIDGTLA